MQNNDWMKRPIFINELDNNTSISHVAFMDENGDSNMKHIRQSFWEGGKTDETNNYFTLTSVLYKINEMEDVKNSFINLKNKYWENGVYKYKDKEKRVCFHSREIRNQKPPFSNNDIPYYKFIEDLTNLMSNLPISIVSSTINKKELFNRYTLYSHDPYELSLTFILERLVRKIRPNDELIIILEARGKKEDKKLLNHMVEIIKNGTQYVSIKQFGKIKGIYFNGKRPRNEPLKSYYGLESADLCSHPIHRYTIDKVKNKAFITIEPKIHGYKNYHGRGIKIFP